MVELRNFNSEEIWAFQGSMNFPDGRKPLIATGDKVTLIVSGFQDGTGSFGIDFIFNENHGELVEAFKCYDNIDRAIADAKLFAQLLDCDLTKEFLSDFGFEVI